MNKEDYSKYYIQGSDHYLIPKDVFIELFEEMSNWKEEAKELKEELKKCYCNRTDCSGRIKGSKTYDSLEQKIKNQQKEFITYLENKINDWGSDNDIDYEVVEPTPQEIFEDVLLKYKKIIGVKDE